jgi:hypothetical protein
MPAPTPPFQGVLFFEDSSGRGWTEKYWFASDVGVTGWQTEFNGLSNARAGLLTNEAAILRMRVESIINRSPYVIVPSGGSPIFGYLQPPQCQADVALLVRFRGSTGYYNRLFLRGIPESVIDGEAYTPTSIFANNFSAWQSYMVGDGNFVVRSRIAASSPKQPLVTAGPNYPKGMQIVVPATVTLNIGQVLYISGSPIPGYNGVKNVVSGPITVTTGKQYNLGGANPISNLPGTALLYYEVLTYSQYALQSAVVEGVSNRKVGRPFGVSRGRRATLFSQRP